MKYTMIATMTTMPITPVHTPASKMVPIASQPVSASAAAMDARTSLMGSID
jgi:hypothetical protein